MDLALCALNRGGSTLNSTNHYFPLAVGSVWSLEGEEDDAFIELTIEVLDETEDVGGVTTCVVEEREWEDGVLFEVSRNFIAEAEAKIVGSGPRDVPAGSFSETIRVRESNPLDGDKGYKVFAKGVGIIVDGPLTLFSYTLGGL